MVNHREYQMNKRNQESSGTGDATQYIYKCRKCGYKWSYTKYNN